MALPRNVEGICEDCSQNHMPQGWHLTDQRIRDAYICCMCGHEINEHSGEELLIIRED